MPPENDNGDGAEAASARRMRLRFHELREARAVMPPSLRDVLRGSRFAPEPAADTQGKPEPV